MFSLSSLAALAAVLQFTAAHTVITYPGWRGDNLVANGTLPQLDVNALGMDRLENGSVVYPYGAQWIYPCGGLPQGRNRTKWPVSGGAIAFQPGWFQGHSVAQIYVNLGINAPGEVAPPNMSHNVIKNVQIVGPTNLEYPGLGFCFPQVPMPANLTFNVGDNLTIQLVEAAQHGAALYSCVDITLAADDDPEIARVNDTNCRNDSQIGFNMIFATESLTSPATTLLSTAPSLAVLVVALLASAFAALT